MLFLSLTITAASLSLARPRIANTYTERKASGIDIIIAMDVSYSMVTPDFLLNGRPVDRALASREVVKSFIKNRPNDRIGIIPFAGRPYQESPITLEHEWLIKKVDKIGPNEELTQGTAIGSAISASATRLDKRKDTKSRIIILVTDGSSNSGQITPIQAAKAAKELGIKIYTVAIGTREGRLPRHIQAFPIQEFDTQTLKDIAEITEAEYFRAKTTDDLLNSFKSIDALEKTDRKRKEFVTYQELHPYCTAVAIAFLIAHLSILIFSPIAAPE